MKRKRLMGPMIVSALCLVVEATDARAQGQSAPTGLANPASQNCAARGGTLRIERRPDGGEYGVCVFADNYQCEEWAMLRGHCPVGGLRVTGYVTAAARYCAITGGRYRPQRRGQRAGRLLAARRQGVRCKRLLLRHLRPLAIPTIPG